MGSPLGPTLINIFMCNFENNWLKDCSHSLKPIFCRCYIDDIFVLFSSLNPAEKFKKCLSSKHPNINFSFEKENDVRLYILDINIFRVKIEICHYWLLEKTFTGAYISFDSFIPETYKTGLVKSLLIVSRKTNSPSNFRVVFVFQTKLKLISFFTFKDKIPIFLHLALLTNLSVVIAMLTIMAKLDVILM